MHSQRLMLRATGAFVVGALLLPPVALAATIATQDVQDVQSQILSTGAFQQNLGNTLSGTLRSVAIKLGTGSSNADFNSGNYYLMSLFDCNSSYTSCSQRAFFLPYSAGWSPGSLDPSTGIAVFPINNSDGPTTYTLVLNTYYQLRFTASTTDTVFGSASATALGGGSFSRTQGAPPTDPDPNVADMAIRLCDTYTCDLTAPDTEPPVMSGTPSDIVAEATSTAGASVTYAAPAATDAVDGAVSVSCSPEPGSLFAMGSTTVVCSAADAAGNTASSTFAVGIYDTTAPAFADIPADSTAEATAASTTVAYTPPTATDAVDGTVAVSCTPVSGWGFDIGSTTVTCNATDAAGNATSSVFVIGVVDTTAPVVTLVGDAAMSIAVGDAFVDPGAAATDLGTSTAVTTTGSVNAAAAGAYTLTYSAADASGNTASTTRTVTVTAPPPPPPPPPSGGGGSVGNGPPVANNPSQGLPQGTVLGVETQAIKHAAAAATEAVVQAAPPAKVSPPSKPKTSVPAASPQPASPPESKAMPPAPSATMGPWDKLDAKGAPLSAAAIGAGQASSPALPLTIGIVLLISLGALARRWV